jgi:hypothetical protein
MGLARMDAPNPGSFCLALLVVCHFKPLRLLFKPRSSPSFARGKEQIAVGVEDLDYVATLEAVGAGEEDLGRQIFNFCGLRSFTPVNSNSPGLVGHGVHFFRTLPPMRAAILKKIQQSQPPRW